MLLRSKSACVKTTGRSSVSPASSGKSRRGFHSGCRRQDKDAKKLWKAVMSSNGPAYGSLASLKMMSPRPCRPM